MSLFLYNKHQSKKVQKTKNMLIKVKNYKNNALWNISMFVRVDDSN